MNEEIIKGQLNFESFLDEFNAEYEKNAKDNMAAVLHPGLSARNNDGKCEHYSKCMCNRYGYGSEEELEKLKPNPQWACAGCCYYCSAHHEKKCKWDCRVRI